MPKLIESEFLNEQEMFNGILSPKSKASFGTSEEKYTIKTSNQSFEDSDLFTIISDLKAAGIEELPDESLTQPKSEFYAQITERVKAKMLELQEKKETEMDELMNTFSGI
jgi:hypothetical protein